MRGLRLNIGVAALVTAGMAGAQSINATDQRAPATAAVDGSGKVVPLASAPAEVEVVGASGGKTALCAGAVALQPDQARALVNRIATEERFYPDFVLSVAKIESRYVSTVKSGKGAYGLMQLSPETAERFKVDICDPADNVRGGVRYLRLLHDRYRNPFFILAAYNAGEEALETSRGVPPYPETVRFVANVMNDFNAWPEPAKSAATSSAKQVREESDGGEAAAAPSSAGVKPAPPGRWSDGFVMHVQ
ncbi:Transglycosylase SLT domain-containing protein [Rhizobiales bacterium GAS113]|nr:Transglycosylase SLT domain-containing protein [Rhizobiales bacterium GAS113]